MISNKVFAAAVMGVVSAIAWTIVAAFWTDAFNSPETLTMVSTSTTTIVAALAGYLVRDKRYVESRTEDLKKRVDTINDKEVQIEGRVVNLERFAEAH